MMTEEDLEYVGGVACAESGLDDRPRCDPRVMAVSYCELTLAPWPGARPRLVCGMLWYPSDAPEEAQAYYVAHEVGHDLLDGYRLRGDALERAASRVGSSVLLPRKAYLRDIAATGMDLNELRRLWPLASPWVHARRIVEVLGGSASRWRRGRIVERVGVPVSCEERLAAAASEEGSAECSNGERGWCVDGDAIVVCAG